MGEMLWLRRPAAWNRQHGYAANVQVRRWHCRPKLRHFESQTGISFLDTPSPLDPRLCLVTQTALPEIVKCDMSSRKVWPDRRLLYVGPPLLRRVRNRWIPLHEFDARYETLKANVTLHVRGDFIVSFPPHLDS